MFAIFKYKYASLDFSVKHTIMNDSILFYMKYKFLERYFEVSCLLDRVIEAREISFELGGWDGEMLQAFLVIERCL